MDEEQDKDIKCENCEDPIENGEQIRARLSGYLVDMCLDCYLDFNQD